MQSNLRFAAVVAIVAAGAGIAAMGKLERQIGFDSVREIWGDLVRDADQVTMKAAHVSTAEEVELGTKLSASMKGAWTEDQPLTEYVTGVAASLKGFVRRKDMPYHFHVVESPQVNAFALPGGEIYVFRGLLEFVESEAELAAILGHEMSHVDMKHCIDHYRYEVAMKRVGAAEVGQGIDQSRRLASIAYSQFQEVEADAQGMRMSIDATYDPEAAARLFQRMSQAFEGKSKVYRKTPAGEAVAATAAMVSDFFRSHPRSEDRSRRLAELSRNEHSRLAGSLFYIGVKNLNGHIPLSEKAFDNEWRRMN